MLIRDLNKGYILYRNILDKNIFLYVLLIIISGLFEGLGISLFIPLLSLENIMTDDSPINGFFRYLFSGLGLELNLENLLVVILLIFTLKAVFLFWAQFVQVSLNTLFISELKKQLMGRLYESEYSYFLKGKSGNISTIFLQEVGRANSSFNHFSKLIAQIINIFIYLGTSFLLNPKFTILALLFGVISFVCLKKLPQKTRKYSLDFSRITASNQDLILQIMKSFRYLKATNSFSQISKKVNQQIVDEAVAQKKMALISALMRIIIEPISVLGITVILLVEVANRGLALQNVLVSAFLFRKIFSQIMEFQGSLNSFSTTVGGLLKVERIKSELEQNKESISYGKYGEITSAPGELFEINNGSLSIEGNQILKNLKVKITKGKSYAIVGPSGGGKTSFLSLLAGLFHSQNGEFTIEGRKISGIDKEKFRSQIGYVAQGSIIFNDTIKNNINLWREDFSTEKFQLACQLANCQEFIDKLPQKADTIIGEGGVQLSGGEIQRISLAREIIKNPALLILDEATNGLDSLSEREFFKNLDQLDYNITILMVSHKLSTIQNVDEIFVFQNGEIVQQGSHEKLKAEKEGLFFSMLQAQELV